MLYKNLIHTATSNIETEFALHQKIAWELKTDIYLTKPYHSSEYEANENTNGLINHIFIKGKNFELITKQEVKEDRIINFI